MKATHKGHCQACGRLQMLPNGDLALHGYTVAHGYFSGTCQGSKHLPFEQSCGMLPGFVKGATAALKTLRDRQAALRVKPTEPRAWVKNYEGVRYGYNSYVWREVTINAEEHFSAGLDGVARSWFSFSYQAPGTNGKVDQKHGVDDYTYKIKSAVDMAHKLNCDYAASMERAAANLADYIAWQEHRIANWKRAELLPVDAKSKAGFVVVE